jgi:hypothetical protein
VEEKEIDVENELDVNQVKQNHQYGQDGRGFRQQAYFASEGRGTDTKGELRKPEYLIIIKIIQRLFKAIYLDSVMP